MVLFVVVEVAVVAVVCFFVGSINPAALLARARGHDLRSSGSGNPGATNAGRVLGRKWGALVLVLDVLKAYLPTLVVLRTMGTVPALVAGFAVVLGHVFSPFLRGRGGKGVACALGTVLAVEPVVALGALVVFALVKTVVPFVGEASVVTMGLVALVGLLAAFGWVPLVEPVVGVWLIALAVLVLWRHRRNILAWWKRRLR
jgi:acyl phosphate:glycerol-3-phosphate acyltransferase